MRCRTGTCLILGLLALPTAAWAGRVPDNSHFGPLLSYPSGPKPASDNPKPLYPMNYTDEAAQTLGFRDGHLDVFSTSPASNPFVPVLSGGVSGGGAMLRLQWRPGQ